MLLLSVLSVILANLIHYFGPAIFLPELDPQKTQDTLFAVLLPSPVNALGYLHSAVCLLLALAVVLLVWQAPQAFKYRSDRKLFFFACLLLAISFPLGSTALSGLKFMGYAYRAGNTIPLTTKEPSRWSLIGLEGFTVYLPPELKADVSGTLDPLEAYDRGVPYAYQGFVPEAPGKLDWFFEHFEVRLGVHQNVDKISAAEFVKRRNARFEGSGMKLNVFLVRDLAVGGLKGMEDIVHISGRDGQYTLTRAILQYKDKFFVISAVVGRDQIVPEYKAVFDEIVKTVSLDRASPPKAFRAGKPAKPRKIHLEEF